MSLILTFLFGVYDVISSLRSLCSQFYSSERGAGEPSPAWSRSSRRGSPRAWTVTRRSVVTLLGALSGSTADSLRRMNGADVPVATLRARGLAVNRELKKVTGTAGPLRRASGAMELGGIPGRLAVDSDVLDDPTLPQPTQRVLHQLEKLNETILLMLDDLVPGGVIDADQSEQSVAV